MFTEQDLQQIADHGLTPARVETQLENFRRGFPWLNVVRAASPADGIVILDAAQADAAVARYEKAAAGLGIVKFVPASGAATRMFKELFEFVNEGKPRQGHRHAAVEPRQVRLRTRIESGASRGRRRPRERSTPS